MRQLIHARYPGTEILGSNYPPSLGAVAAAKFVNIGTFASIGLTHFGDQVWQSMNQLFGNAHAVPEFVQNLQSNKMGSTIGAWFVGNMVSQNLLNTGAFEVFYDGEVIFSKKALGRLPTIPEIMGNLEVAMNGDNKLAHGSGSVNQEKMTTEALSEGSGDSGEASRVEF